MKRFVAMMTLASGLACGGPAQSAPAPAKVTAPPTARLVQFCASEAGDYHDGFCTGYLLGYAYGLDRPGTGVCVPGNINVRQIRNAVTRHLRNHPGALRQDASIAVVAALRASYPCRR
jgi:hypothetical protein